MSDERQIPSELPWSWHRSGGWRAQWRQVQRWHARLLRSSTPADAEDFTFAFFQGCYHLRVWLHQSEFPPSELEKLFSDHAEFRICRDLCNLTKHFELTRRAATEAQPALVIEYAGRGRGWFGEDHALVALSNGRKYDVRDLANRCIEIWANFLAQHAEVGRANQ